MSLLLTLFKPDQLLALVRAAVAALEKFAEAEEKKASILRQSAQALLDAAEDAESEAAEADWRAGRIRAAL